MTRDDLLKLLHDIDHRCIFTRNGDVGVPLAKVIAWLEDEGNKETFSPAKMVRTDRGAFDTWQKGWVLR